MSGRRARGVRPCTSQLPLALQPDSDAVFRTFVDGGNGAALAHVRALASGASSGAVWLSGPSGAGKSHALQAACRAADEAGQRAMYLPLAAAEVVPDMLADLDELDFLALDDVARPAGVAVWEARLFQVLNGFQSREGALLMAADAVPAAAGFALADLASRAAGAVVYRLEPLDDEHQVEALLRHASHRGLDLDPAAARFLQARVPRDMKALCAWLERLDSASLAAQRRLTVPFIRDIVTAASARPPAQRVQQRELDQRCEEHDAGEQGAPEGRDDLDGGGARE